MPSFSSMVVFLAILLVACCTPIFAQSRCVTTAYGPVPPPSPFNVFFVGIASNLISMVPVTLNSTMQVAAIGVYPLATQSSGTLNISCGLYSNNSSGLVLLSQTGPIAVMDLSAYTTSFSNNPMLVYLQPAVSAPAGTYVIGCWWTWTGLSPFQQAFALGAPTTQAIAYNSAISNTTLAFNTSNGLLPATIAPPEQWTEIVSLTPGVLASLVSTSYWCPTSSSSTGHNGASAASTSSFLAMILAGLAMLALLS